MNSRERVLAALNHKQPDRVPIDCGGHMSSNFSVQAYCNLREYLGLKKSELYMCDLIQQLVFPEKDVLDMFGIDVVNFGADFINDESYWKEWSLQDGTPIKIPAYIDIRREDGNSVLYNSNGMPIALWKQGVLYCEQTYYPLAGSESDDFSNLSEDLKGVMWNEFAGPPAPLGYTGKDLDKRKQSLENLRKSTDRAIYAPFGGSIYEMGGFLYRQDNFMIEMSLNPEKIGKYLEKILEIHLEGIRNFLGACGDNIDVMGFGGDDMGMQTGPQISPAMYRDLFKPIHKEMWGYAKKLKPDIKLCLHCCGGIAPLLEDIIDAGMDAVNPVQTSCKGMEVESLKARFGKDLTFWGGGCDTRDILPNATPQQVKDHVRKNLDVMFRDGGFIFQQVHNIVSNVPPANIVAMFEAVREYI